MVNGFEERREGGRNDGVADSGFPFSFLCQYHIWVLLDCETKNIGEKRN